MIRRCSSFLRWFWMTSSVAGSSNAPWKSIPTLCWQHVCPLRTRPWEWLLLIPQSTWLEAGWSNWFGPPLFPPGYHIAVSSCWLLLCATWEAHRLLAARSPWAPFTLTPALSSSLLVSVSLWELQICNAEQKARWPQLFHCLCFPLVLLCTPSPGSQAPLVLWFPLPEWDGPDLTLLI